MHTQNRISQIVAVLAGFLLTAGWSKATTTVAVGDSTLIGTLDYSDTYTENDTTRTDGAYNASGEYDVENTYGNGAESWLYTGNGPWSINNNTSVVPGTGYPGDSGSGSATGITQTGGEAYWGLSYGLRSDFVVQSDFVYSNAATDYIGIGDDGGNMNAGDGLTVVFADHDVLSLFNAQIGTVNLSFDNTIDGTDKVWANFAVEFNLNTDVLTLYADESELGTVDLNTFDSGAFAAVLDGSSNSAVSVGISGDVNWTDNFQVGSATPEPTTYALMLGGVALLVLVARFRKLA